MAVTAIWSVKGSVGKVLRYVANPAKTWNGQYAEAAKFHTVERVLEYDADAMKTEKQFYVTGINCSDSPASAAEQFRATKETWKKPGGIVCFHGYQSFEAGEVTPDIAHEIGVKLAKQLWGDRFQVVVSTHTNTGKIHNHFCLNSVSFTDGKRYYDQKATYYKMREVSDDLCEDYGLSVIENPGRGSKQYKAWLGDKDGTSRRDAVRTDIDAVLEYATSFRQFQIEIQNRGYILEYRGSFLRIRPDEGKKFFRLDRLGDGYSEDEIRERCRCNYENRPRPVRVAFVYQKRERATGIVGLYRHYAYLLKHFPHEVRPFDRTAYAAMRDDARKMKRYSEEAKLLTANDIVTAEDLQHFTESIGTRFKALAYERAKQRNRLRRMHDSTAMQPTKEIIYDLTAQMAELRQQMKLCEDIAERCGVVEMVVNEIERGQIAEKKKPAEKKKCEKGIDI